MFQGKEVAALFGFAAVWFGFLCQGAKACADLHKECKDHQGSNLSVVSLLCCEQGTLVALDIIMPVFCFMLSGVVNAVVGAWVVCVAVHGKLPCSL